MHETTIARAQHWLAQADGVLITAGAGMGVDSGLPDFRGEQGFWRAYPALARAGIRFEEVASPYTFRRDPRLAWGFYGHRLNLYRSTTPHPGFQLLLALAARLPGGAFVFTSNVDGQFQKAGFDPSRITECHGSIHTLQCLNNCRAQYWPADSFLPDIDDSTGLLRSALPTCPDCGSIARPNILMFNDDAWEHRTTLFQKQRMHAWLAERNRVVIIEIGAGLQIPTVRRMGEQLDYPLIRINPRDFKTASTAGTGLASAWQQPAVSLACGALAGLRALLPELADSSAED